MDIVSIEPIYGLGLKAKKTEEMLQYSRLVCACEATNGSVYYTLISVDAYNKYIDPTADVKNADNPKFSKMTYSPAKRIVGVVIRSEDAMEGLSKEIGAMKLIRFESLENIE